MKKLTFLSMLLMLLFTFCKESPVETSLTTSGNWSATANSSNVSLSLVESNTEFSGSAMVSNSKTLFCKVVGINSAGDITFKAVNVNSTTKLFTFTGELIDENTLKGVINGEGYDNVPITFYRGSNKINL